MKPVNTFNSIFENVYHPERSALRRVVEGSILALLLTACGDDSSSSGTIPENTSSIDEVADVSLLPPCTASNEYKIIRVLNEETPRICRDNKWFAIAEESNVQSSDSKDDRLSSSTARPDKSQDEKSSSSVSNTVAKANSSDSQKNESSSTDNNDIIDIVEPRDSIVLDSEKVAVSLDEVSGVTQKGPFLSGSRVLVREMTDGRTLTQTGNSFNGKILNDNGEFKIKARMLVSQYVMLEASGYYRNEITGENSNSELTLFAITNVNDRKVVNMNLLTHLEYERVIYLVTQKKMKVNAAKKQAQQEVLSLLHIDAKNFSNSEDLNIAGASDEDAALLAFSIILQGDRSVSQLSELLTKIAIDMEEDGSWDNATKRTEFADWAFEAEQSGRIKTIRNNVASWKLSSIVPDFEKHIHHFWTTEYGLGACSEDKQGEILQDTNSQSTSKDKYFICADGRWRLAAPIEYDTYEWEVGDDGDSRYGDVVMTNCYVYEDSSWRSGNSRDCSLGLRGCTALRQDTVGKGSDKVWHICDSKAWRDATTYEKDTFGWANGADGEIRKGNVTDTVYVFDKTTWRVTSAVEGKLGGCVAGIADSVGKVGLTYFICKSGSWATATALEYDTYRWSAGKDGDSKSGSVKTSNCYVYENKAWRSGNSSDCLLGLRGCTALRQDTVGKGSDKVWYICDAKNWRNATTYEKDTFGWKDSTDGAIKKGNVTDSIYVFDKTAWRMTSNVEAKLGGCVSAIADSVGKVGSIYYICKSNKWSEASPIEYDTYKWNAGFDGEVRAGQINTKAYYIYDRSKYNWREASTIEKDTYDYANKRAWLAGIDGEIKKGSVTDSIYLYDATAWRTADDIERVLGGCVAAIVDSVGKAGSNYYICSPREWKNATELQYDTYKRNCTEYGQVIYGNVNDGNAYFCYGNEWRHFYGDETKAYGKLVDNRDGKIYRTIEIGDQTWMAENLNYADEDNFPSMKDKNWCYEDEPDSCEKYGRLYTWSAAIDSIYLSSQGEICGYGEKICNASNEKQGICPEQWHLPSLEEWEKMFDYVGGISVAGKILRSKSAWLSDKNGTDDYGFSVVPSGTNDVTAGVNKDPNKRNFTSMKHSAFFWTSSDVDKSDYDTRNRTVTYGVLFYFDYEYAYVSDSYEKAAGRSVRCIKD